MSPYEDSVPGNTSIVELARQVGATSAEIRRLTPDARSLTKDDLLELAGAGDSREALRIARIGFQKAPGRVAAIPARLSADLEGLTVRDIRSIALVFGSHIPVGVPASRAKSGCCCCCCVPACCCCCCRSKN